MTTTNHQPAIDALREWSDDDEYVAASDLLELHDRTGLNLCEAPRLKRFVEKYVRITTGDSTFTVQNNGA